MAMKKNIVPVPKTFEHELFGKIRYFMDGDEIWFVAVDVARALEIQNVRQNLAEFPDDEKAAVCITYTSSNGVSQKREVTAISEPGFYRLIFMSRKPEAEKFKRWVFHDVLPSIRRNGYYVSPQQEIIKIEGRENFKKFKAKFPEGAVEVKQMILDKIMTFYVTVNLSEKS